jgi:hypothetical protein
VSPASQPARFLSKRAVVWLFVGLGLALLAAANFHLVYVAVTTQPDCVAHLRSGEGKAVRNLFSAATSACSQTSERLESKQSE